MMAQGDMTDGEEALIVRAEGRIKTLDDVGAIVVDNNNGIPITVADVAEIKIGALTRYGAVSKNGEGEAVNRASAEFARRQCQTNHCRHREKTG